MTPGDAIEVASAIARRICRDALWFNGTCTWLGLQMQSNFRGQETQAYLLGSDLYGGSAGVAYFLAEAYATTSESIFRSTALGAVRHAHRGARRLFKSSDIGLYSGLAGVVSSALACGKLCKDESSIESAVDVAEQLETTILNSSVSDIISGLAGVVLALLQCWRDLSNDRYLHLAIQCAEKLRSLAVRKEDVVSWESGPHRETLTGYAHGASGIASSFLELYAATGEKAFLDIAEEAFAFEDSHFDQTRGNWRDLRKIAGANQYTVAWCHGAPGILLARLRALEITKSPDYLLDAQTSANTTVEAAQHSLNGQRSDCSLCHGLAGMALCLNSAGRVLGNGKLSSTAETLAVRMFENQKQDGYWSSLFSAREDTPQLMLGTSGVGHLFLTLGQGVCGPSALHLA